MIDYRELLMKYIDHVGECEGITFISDYHRPRAGLFTTEEWEELRRLDAESEKYMVKP